MQKASSNQPLNTPSTRAFDLGRVVYALRRLSQAEAAPWLHQEVSRRLAERLPIIKLQAEMWLNWWGFVGGGSLDLARIYPQAQGMVVEPTAALQAKSQPSKSAWWSAQRAAAWQVLSPDQVQAQSTDLVWANMMLHGVRDPARTLAAWHRALRVDGLVIFSYLGPGTLRELSALYQDRDWPAPMADFVDMHDLGDMLIHAGFAAPVLEQDMLRLSWSSSLVLLEELKTLGGNAAPTRSAGLRTPRWHARLCQALDQLKGLDGRIELSFEVVYAHAFKVAKSAPSEGQASISLQDMRALLQRKKGV